jgi:23S rRNA (guanosine2251-2'-O)-methyltransferase
MNIFGRNPVKEKLNDFRRRNNVPSDCCLILRENDKSHYQTDIITLAESLGIQTEYMHRREFDGQYGRYSHQGVILSFGGSAHSAKNDDKTQETYPTVGEAEMLRDIENKDKSIIVLLDGIKDVGNLGAILRSALLFNVDYVILPKDNSAAVNETAAKRSAGAAFKLPTVTVTNVARCIDELKKVGCWIYAADMNGTDIGSIDFADKSVIVMGEEGSGIRRLVRDKADIIASIPTNDKLDSLNVSVSTGIILYEVNRQRLRKD